MESFRLLIVADTPGWAYDRQAKGLKKYLESLFPVQVDILYWRDHRYLVIKRVRKGNYDIAYLIEPDYLEYLHGQRKTKTVLVGGHNLAFVTPKASEELAKVDWVIVNNRGAYEKHFAGAQNATYLPYAVDTELFRSETPFACRRQTVVWTASAQRDSLKGYSAILCPLKEKLLKCGMELQLRRTRSYADWLTADKLNDWYNTARYVICTSESEGTPTYLLEARACGCVPITTMVGNADDWLEDGKNGVLIRRRTLNGALAACLTAKKIGAELAQPSLRELQSNWSMRRRAVEFYALFRDLYTRRKTTRRRWPDDFADVYPIGTCRR